MVRHKLAIRMAERKPVSAFQQKRERSLLIHQHLRVIAALIEFAAAGDQRIHQLRHPLDRFRHERSSDGANTRVHRVDHQQSIRRKQLPDDVGERRAHALRRC